MLFLVIPALAAVIAVIVLLWTERTATIYVLEGKPCQYYLGNTYRLAEGAILRRVAEDKTVLELGEGAAQSEISSLPIYYEDKRAATLPQNMAYYAPRTGTEKLLPYFTDLRLNQNGITMASRDGKNEMLSPGFVFDGQNLYVFLEPVTVRFNNYKLDLPAFSFVDAMYYGDIVLFNYETKECLVEAAEGAVTAESLDGDYTVALLGDSITSQSGKRTLLITRPELLKRLFD